MHRWSFSSYKFPDSFLASTMIITSLCIAILKDSQFTEVDRAECQFSTTATVLDNGTQVLLQCNSDDFWLNVNLDRWVTIIFNLQVTNPFQIPETHPKGFFESIRIMWTKIINGLVDFITGDTCRLHTSSNLTSLRIIMITWKLN